MIPNPELVLLEAGKVKVTNLWVTIGSRRYPLSNIASVEVGRGDPGSCLRFALVFGALGSGYAAACMLSQGTLESVAAFAILGLLLIGAAIWSAKAGKPTFTVKLGNASGKWNILESRDLAVIQRIVAAINEAILLKM